MFQGVDNQLVQLGYLLWGDGKKEDCERLCCWKQRCFGRSFEKILQSWWFVHVSNGSISFVCLYAAGFSVVVFFPLNTQVCGHFESKSMLEFNKNFPVMLLFSACASGQQRSNSKHNVHTGHGICCTILHCHDFGSWVGMGTSSLLWAFLFWMQFLTW